MGLLKDLGKEIFIYVPAYVYLTLFGGFWNEMFNTWDLFLRKFSKKKREEKNPIPIFLIPGTLGGRGTMFPIKRKLKRYFKDVFIFKPKRFELVSLEKNIKKLDDFIKVKLKLVGQKQLILIGHSQGGIIARRWLNMYDPKKRITIVIITLGTPHVGSWTAALALPIMWWSRAVWQLTPPFARDLNKTPSSELTISIEGKSDIAFWSWPFKPQVKERIKIPGMHISPIFENKAFEIISQIILKKVESIAA